MTLALDYDTYFVLFIADATSNLFGSDFATALNVEFSYNKAVCFVFQILE